MPKGSYVFTSESVSEGHPDKVRKASDVLRMLQEMRAVQAVFASSSRNS